jgi:hypothetical protein
MLSVELEGLGWLARWVNANLGGSRGAYALHRARQHPRRKMGAKAQAIGPSRGGQTTNIHALTDLFGGLPSLVSRPAMSAILRRPTRCSPAPGPRRVLSPIKAMTPIACAAVLTLPAPGRSSRAAEIASVRSVMMIGACIPSNLPGHQDRRLLPSETESGLLVSNLNTSDNPPTSRAGPGQPHGGGTGGDRLGLAHVVARTTPPRTHRPRITRPAKWMGAGSRSAPPGSPSSSIACARISFSGSTRLSWNSAPAWRMWAHPYSPSPAHPKRHRRTFGWSRTQARSISHRHCALQHHCRRRLRPHRRRHPERHRSQQLSAA